MRRARRLLSTDLAYLTLYDAEAGDTFMRATDGSVSAAFQSVRLALGAGLGGLVASTRKPYWTADYWSDERFRHTSEIDGAVGEEGIVAICGTPLIVESHFVGVLFAANRSSRPFTREEVGPARQPRDAGRGDARADPRPRRRRDRPRRALRGPRDGAGSMPPASRRRPRPTTASPPSCSTAVASTTSRTPWRSCSVGGPCSSTSRVSVAAPPARRPSRPTRGSGPLDALDALPGLGSGRLVERDGVYAVAITAARERLGTIYVGGVGTLGDSDQRTLERAGVVTALVMLFERQAADARQSARNRLVSDLVAARGSAEERTQLAATAGFDTRRPFCLLVIRGDGPTGHRGLLISASAASGPGALVGSHDGDVVALVPDDESSDAASLAKAVAARIGKRTCVTVAGVGPISDLARIPSAHEEGARTVSALIALGHRGIGAAATQLGFAGLIVGSDPDVGDYVQRLLGPLLDYDARRGTDLVGTLAAYFAAGGSPRHAAGTLHVHVNTVSQRLERISALLGESWQQPDIALELQLALRLRALQGPR